MTTRFSILILTIGIPGAGKSTWVNEYKKTHPYVYVISTDEIRKEVTGVEQCIDPSMNTKIHSIAKERVKAILDNPDNYGLNKGLGPEIIVDSTNVDVQEWVEYKNLGSTVIVGKVFNTTPDQAMKNQNNRERLVPREIVDMKWERLQRNKKYLNKIFNMLW